MNIYFYLITQLKDRYICVLFFYFLLWSSRVVVKINVRLFLFCFLGTPEPISIKGFAAASDECYTTLFSNIKLKYSVKSNITFIAEALNSKCYDIRFHLSRTSILHCYWIQIDVKFNGKNLRRITE